MSQETLPVVAPLGIGARILYSVLFGVVFWLLCWALAATTIAQLVLKLVSQSPSADLTKFGAGLGTYARQLIEFLTCAADRLPFPFSDWPGVDAQIKREDIEHL
jgi:hypothetical protein